MELRPMTPDDRFEVAELIHASINVWYRDNGHPEIRFHGGPRVTEVFYESYNGLTPGCNVVAVNGETGRIMGSCFYHPRETHVALGIMNVHPNYFGRGVGRALLAHICDFTDSNGYRSLRLTQSALNLDSFSLYTRAGFVPRWAYQDMYLPVPAGGLGLSPPGADRVRDATLDDVPAMVDVELDVSGVNRELDFRYLVENAQGFWHAAVVERPEGGIDGFMISSGHQAMNILGPCVARSEEAAGALVARELDQYPGRTPLFLAPVECEQLVRQAYEWGARNSELHFCQVRGEFRPFRGVNMPTFMLETA
jgi:GNAT superfamily N-acetyltransferase